jgi:hypothetical protein
MTEYERELGRLEIFLQGNYPDEWRKGRASRDSAAQVAIRLLDPKMRLTTGAQIFEILRSCDALDMLSQRLKVELNDASMAEYLRTTAQACDDPDESRLLRDAADVLEYP